MTRRTTSALPAAALAVASIGIAEPAPAPTLSAADRAAAFRAAGFAQKGDAWVRCEEETPTASHLAGRLEVVDLDRDGRPEAWVTESSVFCYGATGQATVLVTKQPDDTWRKVLDEVGVAVTLETRHLGWPDIEVGGPGFEKVLPHRWNGTTYVRSR